VKFKCLGCRRKWSAPLLEVRCRECGSKYVMRLRGDEKQPPDPEKEGAQ
jgi:DNA-directed RNA polymerase subunit RPC12/RpoP